MYIKYQMPQIFLIVNNQVNIDKRKNAVLSAPQLFILFFKFSFLF